jgi:hypothetical protein
MYVYTYMNTYMNTYMYMYIYVYIYFEVYIHIYMYEVHISFIFINLIVGYLLKVLLLPLIITG